MGNYLTYLTDECNGDNQAINSIGDDIWIIIDNATMEERELHFDDFDKFQKEWIQKLTLTQYQFSDNKGTLNHTYSTMKGFADGAKALIRYTNSLPQNKQQLSHWDLSDAKQLISDELIKNGELKSVTYIRRLVNALKTSYESRYVLDGFKIELPNNFLVKVVSPILQKYDIIYADWERGGQRNTLPISVGTLMLADAIKLIRSDRVSLLKLYFDSFRKGEMTKALIRGKKGVFALSIDEFSNCGYTGTRLTKPKQNTLRKRFVAKVNRISPNAKEFPFQSQQDINDFIDEIWGACIAIFLSVTAIRVSELKRLKSHWANAIKYLDVNGNRRIDATFSSKNIKTGAGVLSKKGLSPLGLEVFDLINALSWVDKEELKLDLFCPAHKTPWLDESVDSKTRTGISETQLGRLLKKYYKNFLLRVDESVAHEFPSLSNHQLRHYKMAFALRKFDGNVEEVIREEFRHHNQHTESYSRHRLNEVEVNEVENEFINEIIQRILIGDESDKWVGNTVKQIRRLSEKLLNKQPIELLPVTDLVNHVENIRNNIHSLTFHSYGVCIVLKKNISKAKCGVKDNIVQVGNAKSPKCYVCVNYGASCKSHEGHLELNKARWQEVADNQLLEKFPFINQAKQVVKKIDEIQQEMRGER